MKETKSNDDYSDIALYGKSDTTNIVGLQPIYYNEKATMRVYKRFGEHVIHTDHTWYPWGLVNDPESISHFPDVKYYKLNGDLHFSYLVYVDNYTSWKPLKKYLRSLSEGGEGYLISNNCQSWLMQTGNTLFKGMDFDDVYRVQLDGEMYGKYHFPNASNPDDYIYIAALSDNRGQYKIIHTRPDINIEHGMGVEGEKELLIEVGETIKDWDPDVIELHNGFGFDLPYFKQRCKLHKVKMDWGREDNNTYSYPSSFRAAERTIDYDVTIIPGRHVVDTMFAAMAYDVFKRELPGYGLKVVATYFGFSDETRTYIDGNLLWKEWDENPERVLKYALEDVRETRDISSELLPSVFYMSQIIPMNYEEIARRGTGSKVESLMVREYIRQRHSIPLPQPSRGFIGGLTGINEIGIVGPIVYADVESMYPAIMINCDATPSSDVLNVFKPLLISLTDKRFESKRLMKKYEKEGNKKLQRKYEGRQAAEKININSMFGYQGWGYGSFNDYDSAELTTKTGQDIISKINDIITEDGGRVIELDTDGVMFVPPDFVYNKEDEDDKQTKIKLFGEDGCISDEEYVKGMTDQMIPGIIIGFDGRGRKILSYKAKNYILEDYSGYRKIKGSSFRSRGMERFARSFIKQGFFACLDGGIPELRRLYLEYRGKIINHELTVDELSVSKNMTKSIKEYKEGSSKLATYEVAMKLIDKYGENVGKGEKVSYYISGVGHKPSYLVAKPIREYTVGDANVSHYLGRLKTLTEKFKPLFHGEDFANLFMEQPSLFNIDYDEIKTQVTKL